MECPATNGTSTSISHFLGPRLRYHGGRLGGQEERSSSEQDWTLTAQNQTSQHSCVEQEGTHELPHPADGLWGTENQFSSRVWPRLGPTLYQTPLPDIDECTGSRNRIPGYTHGQKKKKGVNLGEGKETGSGKSCGVVGVCMIKIHCMHV